MPARALQHFDDDIARVRAMIEHADRLPVANSDEKLLSGDILRSAWMFAVGALDAYFSHAYSDLVAATIISKGRHPSMVLPEFFYDIRFPVRNILEPYPVRANWRWRMAARRMMDRDNVLKLEKIQSLFNNFFRSDRRLFSDTLHDWLSHPDANRRLFGIAHSAYAALSGPSQQQARRKAKEQLRDRFKAIFQRRHDCIHNCDRPRVSPQPLGISGTVLKVVRDVEFLVRRCDEHINVEFPAFLTRCGCPPAIIARTGY